MKRLLAISIASIAIGAIPALAEVDAKTHKLCLEAKDYLGCIKAQGKKTNNEINTSACDKYLGTFGSTYIDCLKSVGVQGFRNTNPQTSYEPESDDVEVKHGFTYRKSTVKQLKVRGTYGRYLTFWGRSMNAYQGTPGYYNPGSPGSVNCSTNSFGYTTTTSCNRTGYIAPSYSPGTQGGTQRGWFEYELDCRDGTYNRKGDISQGIYKKGWQDVYYDPTAKAVAARYCRRITSLPLKVESQIKQMKKKKCTVKDLQNREC